MIVGTEKQQLDHIVKQLKGELNIEIAFGVISDIADLLFNRTIYDINSMLDATVNEIASRALGKDLYLFVQMQEIFSKILKFIKEEYNRVEERNEDMHRLIKSIHKQNEDMKMSIDRIEKYILNAQ